MTDRKSFTREELPGSPFFVCCLCSPDVHLDNASSALFNLECAIHGRTWHRKMIRLADGSVALFYNSVTGMHRAAGSWAK
jgi:hypothetical protein